jgi:hypothetical protein
MMIRGALLLLLAGCGPAPDVAVGSGGAESSTTEEVQESSSSSSSTTSTSSAVTTWEPPDRCERWPSEGCGQVLGENAAVSGKTPFGNADLRYAFFIPKCGCCNSCIDLVYAAIYFVADPEGPWNTQSRRAIRVEVNQDRYTAALLGTAYVYSTYDRPDIGVQGPLVVDHFPSIGSWVPRSTPRTRRSSAAPSSSRTRTGTCRGLSRRSSARSSRRHTRASSKAVIN